MRPSIHPVTRRTGFRLGVGVGLRLKLRLGGGVVGSVLVAAPGSVHSTCIELQLSSYHNISLGIGLGLRLGL